MISSHWKLAWTLRAMCSAILSGVTENQPSVDGGRERHSEEASWPAHTPGWFTESMMCVICVSADRHAQLLQTSVHIATENKQFLNSYTGWLKHCIWLSHTLATRWQRVFAIPRATESPTRLPHVADMVLSSSPVFGDWTLRQCLDTVRTATKGVWTDLVLLKPTYWWPLSKTIYIFYIPHNVIVADKYMCHSSINMNKLFQKQIFLTCKICLEMRTSSA